MTFLGEILRHQGKLAEAESMHTSVLVARRQLLGEDHPDTDADQI